MALLIKQHAREGILILDLIGHLTIGPEDAQLRTAVQSCVAAGNTKIILNCKQLGAIDSAGLGTLLLFYVKLRRAGGNVVLLNVAPTHIELLLLMKLETVFEVFADEQDAINSFFRTAQSSTSTYSNLCKANVERRSPPRHEFGARFVRTSGVMT